MHLYHLKDVFLGKKVQTTGCGLKRFLACLQIRNRPTTGVSQNETGSPALTRGTAEFLHHLLECLISFWLKQGGLGRLFPFPWIRLLSVKHTSQEGGCKQTRRCLAQRARSCKRRSPGPTAKECKMHKAMCWMWDVHIMHTNYYLQWYILYKERTGELCTKVGILPNPSNVRSWYEFEKKSQYQASGLSTAHPAPHIHVQKARATCLLHQCNVERFQ